MRLHSSQITGSLTVSGSIVPDGSGSWDLGSESHPWRDLHILSSSIKIYSDKEEVGRLQLGTNNELEFFDVRELTATQRRTFTPVQIRANATRKDFRGATSGKANTLVQVGISNINEISVRVEIYLLNIRFDFFSFNFDNKINRIDTINIAINI